MSWDVLLHKTARGPYNHCNDIPEDESSIPLGSLEQVRAAICSVFAGTDWSKAAWRVYQGAVGSIEFNLGSAEPCDSVMLHIRAADDTVIAPIIKVCECLQCQALDCGTGAYLERSAQPNEGLSRWQTYRSRVVDG